MTHRPIRKAATVLALPLLLAGCGSSQSPNATIDEKVAAAEKAADRAEKAQKATEEALRAMAGGGGSAQISYDEAVNELDDGKDKAEDDTSSPFSRQSDNRALGSGESRVNSDGVEELATPPG